MNFRNLFFIVSLATSRLAHAQAADGAPNFDLLKAAHGADSLRRVAARQQSELVRLARVAAANADTVSRQRRELAQLRAATVTPPSPKSDALVVVSAATPAPALAVTAPVMPAPMPAVVTKAAIVDSVKTTPTPAPTPVAAAAPAPRAAALPLPVLTGLVQFWLLAGDGALHNTYRLRRAEVKASGVASPTVSWAVMLDLGKALSASSVTAQNGSVQTTVSQGSRALQDAAIMVQATPSLRIDLGQQKLPFGLEGAQSSATLETVERALFASDRGRGGTYGDVRDVGVALRGRFTRAVDYVIGTFNGSGESQNDVDANSAKALVARLVVRPFDALQLGASGIYAGTAAADAPRRDRDGVDIRFRTNKLLIQMEGVSGHDASLSRHGVYVHTGYRVQPTVDIHARFDAWDPDIAREAEVASATERDYMAGFSWTLPFTALKTQADLARRTWSSGLSPNRWQLSMNLQTTW